MNFKLGQTFDGIYPPEAAVWCNENNAYIDAKDRGYIIVQWPSPEQAEEA